MVSLVLHEIKNKYDEVNTAGFCLKSDASWDRDNIENLSIIIWLFCNSWGIPDWFSGPESVGCQVHHNTDTETSLRWSLQYWQHNQCYDGSPAMSGLKGGVQTLLQKRLAAMFHTYTVSIISFFSWCMLCKLSHVLKHFLSDQVHSAHSFIITILHSTEMHHLWKLLEIRLPSHYQVVWSKLLCCTKILRTSIISRLWHTKRKDSSNT